MHVPSFVTTRPGSTADCLWLDGGGYGLSVVYVVAALALAGAVLLIITGLLVSARLVHIGHLDAMELAEKLGSPEPVSALDWPELHIRGVVPQPDHPCLMMLLVSRPRHERTAAILLVRIELGGQSALPLLSAWCAARASVAPSRRGDAEFELRRRQSLERVRGSLLAEDAEPALARLISDASRRQSTGGS